jgi:hypothetical protein
MNPLTLERFRRVLDSCCGTHVTKPKVITGIERMALQPSPMLDEISDEYHRTFGGRDESKRD